MTRGEVLLAVYKICLVGECSEAQLLKLTEYIKTKLSKAGYRCTVYPQSIWENSSPPSLANLVLQTGPYFMSADVGCPVINIKPMLKKVYRRETIQKVIDCVKTGWK